MIRMTNIVFKGLEFPPEMILPAGLSAVIYTARELENEILVRLLLGFIAPDSGEFSIYDDPPHTLREAQLIELRRKIGVVYHDGGLISNLDIWDNLTLQLSYMSSLKKSEIESKARSVLELVGFDGSLSVLPSRLTLYQRRIVAMARCMLAEPELMVYQSSMDGLSSEEQTIFRRIIRNYNEHGPGITSLFLTSFPESLKGMNFDFSYSTGGTRQP